MGNIIIALPNEEVSKKISAGLLSHGYDTTVICRSGSDALSEMSNLDAGVVICGSHFSDMELSQFADYLPQTFNILAIIKQEKDYLVPEGILKLFSPCKMSDIIDTVGMLLENTGIKKKRKKKDLRPERSTEEKETINRAKVLLMDRNNMSEPEAFRYIQKCSMDSGTNMYEMAQMILMMTS
ncbi:MAG: ANTAR domain-containing protein [Lachnospiraceae bacterium]|jgi:hypothetical protein|nr:ANTAR domain-containing protein [Lachnospiraceae bacterium]MEE3461270.1 ANTAR domain-containing protein [Lachnospiraceae bacterium]